MLNAISFFMDPKSYIDQKFLELKSSLNEIIVSSISSVNNIQSHDESLIADALKKLNIIQPKANTLQLENVLCWMISNTQDYTKFPIMIKNEDGSLNINETWKSLSDWIVHVELEKNNLLLQVAVAEEQKKQAEKDAIIAAAEKEVAAKKAAADAALAAAAIAAQQAQEAINTAASLKK